MFSNGMTKFIFALVIMSVLSFSLVACTEEGPAEKAGKKIDQAVDDAKEGMDNAKDKVKKLFD